MYTASCLRSVTHGFFTRKGGVSTGVFDSLNFVLTKGDSVKNVEQNRKIALTRLGLPHKQLVTMNQVHGDRVILVDEPWSFNVGATPEADALITQNPNLVLGIFTADCVPILLHDPKTSTIAVIHAGWKGANNGIVSSTLTKLKDIGVSPENLQAAIGPTIAQKNYEVGPEVYVVFKTNYQQYFLPSSNANHYLFDLSGVVEHQLKSAGIGSIENTRLNTYEEEKDFFSCRRSFHRNEKSFGCQLSAISLPA